MAIIKMTDLDLAGKRVLIREDLNVPMKDGRVADDSRLRACLPTIAYALNANARVILMSHLGRPQEGHYEESLSLKPVAQRLGELLGRDIRLVKDWATAPDVAPGKVVLLENVRFNKGEMKNDDELAQRMAGLCDVFVMDAFGTAHRAEASTHAVAKFASTACAGPLLVKELEALGKALEKPTRPLVAIVAGSKVSTKLTVLKSLAYIVDHLIVGGGIANTFLLAQGHAIGKSIAEPDMIGEAKEIISIMRNKGAEVPIPTDVVCGKKLEESASAQTKSVNDVAADDMILDIGPETCKRLEQLLARAGTIVWNGPVGVFEFDQFANGTRAISRAVAASKAISIAGGGDTLAAIAKYKIEDKVSYISTGGGAFLEFLEGKKLPAVEILEERAREKGRRTKIIATLGPSSRETDVLGKILDAGVDVIRLNFSHGDHAQHRENAKRARECAQKRGRDVGIVVDLQGPKIRIGKFASGKITLENGNPFILDIDWNLDQGNSERVGVVYQELTNDVKENDTLLLADGKIELKVNKVDGKQIICKVMQGGELSSNAGINLKGGGLNAAALTDKDKEDIKVAAEIGADYLAVSFPCCGADMRLARKLLQQAGGKAKLIAKIERAEAYRSLDEILDESDAVMVARGDLAVEMGDARVPALQKNIIARARDKYKPVIIATQMMQSMVKSPNPTRAEVSDVANAVLDGADAVMLSEETAIGEFPVAAVSAMSRVCLEAEKSTDLALDQDFGNMVFERIDQSIAMAASFTAYHLKVKAIGALTESGSTPLWMSRINSGVPIYALTPQLEARGRVTLYRNVYPIEFVPVSKERDDVLREAIQELVLRGLVVEGDSVLLTIGELVGEVGGTNTLKIVRVGH